MFFFLLLLISRGLVCIGFLFVRSPWRGFARPIAVQIFSATLPSAGVVLVATNQRTGKKAELNPEAAVGKRDRRHYGAEEG